MKKDLNTPNVMSRRRLLARVGLIAGAAYVAPTMMGLNAAHASGASGGNSGGNSGASGGNSGPSNSNSGPSRSNSGPSRSNSGPSRNNSGPSRGRNSRPSRGRGNGNDMPLWLRRLMQGA